MQVQDLELLAYRFIEESNDAIFVLDCDRETISQANPTAIRLTERPWRDLRGATLDSLLQSEDGATWTEVLSAVRHTGVFHSEEGYSLLRPSGEPLPVNVSISRVHLTDRVVALVIARDVSERIEYQDMLREFNTELECRVRDQTAALREANRNLTREIDQRRKTEDELREVNQQLRETIIQLDRAQEAALRRERLQTLDQVAAGVAHDINNSLSSVLTYTELLSHQLDQDDQKSWANSVLKSAHDIRVIVERLRRFCGKSGSDQADGAIALRAVVLDVIELTRPKWQGEATRKGKAISITPSIVGDPEITGDPSAVRSLLTNLIFNSVDAIEVHGNIAIHARLQDGLARLEVVDDGAGMTESQRSKCTQPFFTTKDSGTGLGLSVCKAMVDGMGGKFEVDSEPAVGTTIRILFPSAQRGLDDATQAPDPKPHAATELSGRRVLYIDDNESARHSMTALLSSLGMRVESAANGSAGLERFQETAFDAVITDMNMPDTNGLIVTAEIKRRVPDVPIILISGWIVDEPPQRTPASPDVILQKPITWQTLQANLIEILPSGDDET